MTVSRSEKVLEFADRVLDKSLFLFAGLWVSFGIVLSGVLLLPLVFWGGRNGLEDYFYTVLVTGFVSGLFGLAIGFMGLSYKKR